MDVLESLNGMLIKGLGCGLRCRDHLQLQNVPLEMSVIKCTDKAALLASRCPLQHFSYRLVGLDGAAKLRQKQFKFHKPAAILQNYFVLKYNGNRQSKANM